MDFYTKSSGEVKDIIKFANFFLLFRKLHKHIHHHPVSWRGAAVLRRLWSPAPCRGAAHCSRFCGWPALLESHALCCTVGRLYRCALWTVTCRGGGGWCWCAAVARASRSVLAQSNDANPQDANLTLVGERGFCLLNEQRHWRLQNQARGSRLGSLY